MRIGICFSLVSALVVAAMPPSGAQTPVRGVITNIRAGASGGTVEITSDLASPKAGLAFDVSIEASEDGGKSFPVKLSSVTGDVGPAVMPGASKRVIWNAARDVERAAFDRFQFRITATAVPRAGLPEPKPSGGAQPASAGSPSSGGGGGKKWLLIGGGVAAAGAAAALAGGSSTPAVVPPTIGDVAINGATDVLLASANAVTFVVTAAMTQGETYTATWTFGDGTSGTAAIANGTASVQKNYSTAGTFMPRVTVTGSRGGSTSRDYRTLTVATMTGRWIARFAQSTFTINLTQNGSQVTGDATYEGPGNFRNPGRATGSVSGPPSRMIFNLTGADNACFCDTDVSGSADQRTFTGNIITAGGPVSLSMTKQ